MCDVAFVRDTTWNDYCGGGIGTARNWCLPIGTFRNLDELPVTGFGRTPGNSFLTRNISLSNAQNTLLLTKLLNLGFDAVLQTWL